MPWLGLVALLLGLIVLPWQAPGQSSHMGQESDTTVLPNITITVNQSVFSREDTMVVTVGTSPSPGLSEDRWFPLVGLLTPAADAENEVVIYRFDPTQEFITLNEAVDRVISDGSFARVAARPAAAVTAESVAVLNEPLPLALPGGFPAGSYLWVAIFFSEDGSKTTEAAIAPVTVGPGSTDPTVTIKLRRGT